MATQYQNKEIVFCFVCFERNRVKEREMAMVDGNGREEYGKESRIVTIRKVFASEEKDEKTGKTRRQKRSAKSKREHAENTNNNNNNQQMKRTHILHM